MQYSRSTELNPINPIPINMDNIEGDRSISGLSVQGEWTQNCDTVLTPEALKFIQKLEDRFGNRRIELLHKRLSKQLEIDEGRLPEFLPETKDE